METTEYMVKSTSDDIIVVNSKEDRTFIINETINYIPVLKDTHKTPV